MDAKFPSPSYLLQKERWLVDGAPTRRDNRPTGAPMERIKLVR
jgi:hypothetical protein